MGALKCRIHKAPRGFAMTVSIRFHEFRFFSVSSCSTGVFTFHNVSFDIDRGVCKAPRGFYKAPVERGLCYDIF